MVARCSPQGRSAFGLFEYVYCGGSVTKVPTKPPQSVTVSPQLNLLPLSVAPLAQRQLPPRLVGVALGDGEGVAAVIILILRVALDPMAAHLVLLAQLQELRP